MPFTCKFQLNNGAINEDDIVFFDEFIESSFGNFHVDEIKIAKIFLNGKEAFIYSTCPCFITSKGNLQKGNILNENTILGYFSANGEDIPYKKPFAKIKF